MIDFRSKDRSSVPLNQCVGMMGRNDVSKRFLWHSYHQLIISSLNSFRFLVISAAGSLVALLKVRSVSMRRRRSGVTDSRPFYSTLQYDTL